MSMHRPMGWPEREVAVVPHFTGDGIGLTWGFDISFPEPSDNLISIGAQRHEVIGLESRWVCSIEVCTFPLVVGDCAGMGMYLLSNKSWLELCTVLIDRRAPFEPQLMAVLEMFEHKLKGDS